MLRCRSAANQHVDTSVSAGRGEPSIKRCQRGAQSLGQYKVGGGVRR